MNFNEKRHIAGLILLKKRVINLRKLRTHHEFLEYVCKIRWLICFIRLDLHAKWVAESSAYSETVALTRKKALAEVESAYQKLKNCMSNNELLGTPSIKKRMCIIDTMLSSKYDFREDQAIKGSYICNHCDNDIQSHRASVFPYFERCLFDQVKYLCRDILNLGQEDLTKGFVETIELNGIKHIDRVFFAPSIFKSIELESQLDFGPDMHPWFAWNMICNIESIKSEKIRDNFRKAKKICHVSSGIEGLWYNSIEDYVRNAKWLEIHGTKAQIELIEHKRQGSLNNDYKSDSLNVALDVILQDVFKGEFALYDSNIQPHALELLLDEDDILYLRVEWATLKVE